MAKAAKKAVWPDEVGISHFAQTIGISERRVYDLAKTGIVVRGSKPGSLLARQSLHGYLDYLRRRAADVPSAAPLRLEKLKSEIIGRQIQEIKLASIRESILTMDEVAESWSDFAGRIKKMLLALPQTVIAQLPHLTANDRTTLQTMVLDILESFVDEAEASVIGSDPQLLNPTPADRAGMPRRRTRR